MKRYFLALGTISCAFTPKIATASTFKLEDDTLLSKHRNNNAFVLPQTTNVQFSESSKAKEIQAPPIDSKLAGLFQAHGFTPPQSFTPYAITTPGINVPMDYK